MNIAICGSMQFGKEMLEAKRVLEGRGHRVVVPAGIEAYASGEKLVENKWDKIAGDLMKAYWDIIKASEAVLIINLSKNGIEHYVGGNALIEMAMAYAYGKVIYLLHPIPAQSYSDEIGAMKPIVLNGDLGAV